MWRKELGWRCPHKVEGCSMDEGYLQWMVDRTECVVVRDYCYGHVHLGCVYSL